MPRDVRALVAGLTRKGFVRRENDHTFLHLYVGGRKTAIYTKVSHGAKEISDKLLGVMARQVRLSRQQFLALVDCRLSEADYLRILRESNAIP